MNTVTISNDGPYPYVFFYTAYNKKGATTCGNVGLGLDKDEPNLTLQDLRAVEKDIAAWVLSAHGYTVNIALTGYKRIASLT